MTQRPADSHRLPTLTEVIEYEGEVMTVRSIVPPNGSQPEAVSTRAPTADAGGDGMQAAQEAQEMPAQTLELLLHRFGEALEPQLRAALAPMLEQIVQCAVDAARCSLAQSIRAVDPRVAAAAVIVPAPQRASPAVDAAGATP